MASDVYVYKPYITLHLTDINNVQEWTYTDKTFSWYLKRACGIKLVLNCFAQHFGGLYLLVDHGVLLTARDFGRR